MYRFIMRRKPKSYNSWKTSSKKGKDSYRTTVQESFKRFNPQHVMPVNDLYGILYYFFKKDFDNDADNLSKPLWDCLIGAMYSDDKQIKMRTVGMFDLSANDFNVLDFSGLDGETIEALLDAFDQEEHVVYVECGVLSDSMFKFNLTKDAN
jgi:Holliday junction resolvase RusA-like endonuclease